PAGAPARAPPRPSDACSAIPRCDREYSDARPDAPTMWPGPRPDRGSRAPGRTMIQLNRGRSRTTTDEYGRRIAVLHDEIFKLEQVLEAPPVAGDVGASEVAVRRLRASIVHEELVRKRAEFESLATE